MINILHVHSTEVHRAALEEPEGREWDDTEAEREVVELRTPGEHNSGLGFDVADLDKWCSLFDWLCFV